MAVDGAASICACLRDRIGTAIALFALVTSCGIRIANLAVRNASLAGPSEQCKTVVAEYAFSFCRVILAIGYGALDVFADVASMVVGVVRRTLSAAVRCSVAIPAILAASS